jgi:hypothetical protein
MTESPARTTSDLRLRGGRRLNPESSARPCTSSGNGDSRDRHGLGQCRAGRSTSISVARLRAAGVAVTTVRKDGTVQTS